MNSGEIRQAIGESGLNYVNNLVKKIEEEVHVKCKVSYDKETKQFSLVGYSEKDKDTVVELNPDTIKKILNKMPSEWKPQLIKQVIKTGPLFFTLQ